MGTSTQQHPMETVFDMLFADLRTRGIACSEPTDPITDPAFIALLTEIYAMAPHEYPAEAPLDVPASQPGSHYRRMPPKLRCCRPSGLALPRVRSSRLTLTPDGVGLRSRNCCASRETCGLDLAVPERVMNEGDCR